MAHVALQIVQEKKDVELLKQLLSCGVDLTKPGWFEIKDEARFGPPIDLSAYFKSRNPQDGFWSEIIEMISSEDRQNVERRMKKINMDDLAADIEEEVIRHQYQQSKLAGKFEWSTKMLKEVKANLERIEELRTKVDFMSEEDITKEIGKVEVATKIAEEISKIENDERLKKREADLQLLKIEAEKPTARCLSCQRYNSQTKIWKCANGHFYCMTCYPNQPSMCGCKPHVKMAKRD